MVSSLKKNITGQLPREHFLEDPMNMVRVLGSDIYQTRIGKFLLKLTFIFYLALLVAQLYFFFLAATTENLINHAPLFLQMCYVIPVQKRHNLFLKLLF
jgi:hypothetical protein